MRRALSYINRFSTTTHDYQGNIRAVIDPDGTAIQTTDYYPYGLPMPTSTGASQNRYKYGAKELETRNGLNFHDFEARMLFNDHTLFGRPDDKAGKYPGFNPYLYCAANPLRYVDPTGMDYSVYFDFENNQITISATYFTIPEDEESAKNAVKLWNDLSDKVSYGNYNIKFDLKVITIDLNESPVKKGSQNSELKILQTAATINGDDSNIYRNVTELKNDNNSGETRAGTIISINTNLETTYTGAHEIGHTLGLIHSNNGVMTPSSDDKNRNGTVSQAEINTIIIGAFRDINGGTAGKGHIKYSIPQK